MKENAESSGTDVAGYVTEGPGLSAYALSDGTVYRTYVTTARGLEPAMAYYGLLDRTPMGRDEGGDRPSRLRRHDAGRHRFFPGFFAAGLAGFALAGGFLFCTISQNNP